ncbi:hypothetical protein D5S19_05555 [Amycolatopsis panacis]|uniref:Uncharacterized protein n=1 Tax=Amycolatopsis panacis TaxID=2340917 RepID=A0A419I9B8_9PSEU|nr:hypothetical protein D5S19_05555 [Amycolatopsis panacis]
MFVAGHRVADPIRLTASPPWADSDAAGVRGRLSADTVSDRRRALGHALDDPEPSDSVRRGAGRPWSERFCVA